MTDVKESKKSKCPDFVILAKPTDAKFLSILQDHLHIFDSILVIVPPDTILPAQVLQTLLCFELVSFYHVKTNVKVCTMPPTNKHAVVYDCILLWETNLLLSEIKSRCLVYDVIKEIPQDSPTVFGFVQGEISSSSAKIIDRFASTKRTTMISNYLGGYHQQHDSSDDQNFLALQCTEWLKK